MTVAFDASRIERRRSLKSFTTLRAGGPAEHFFVARTADDLASVAEVAQRDGWSSTVLGWGSNVLPADRGVPGLTVVNRADQIHVHPDGVVVAESGCSFQGLFLTTAQHRLAGLEFAVGIPGTLGGALVSNAGAYRSNVSEFLTRIEVVFEGRRQWVEPAFMEFSYRDSILRRADPPACAIVQVELRLPDGDPKAIYDEAREYQRQRISKQPAPASAGSFFKNVNDQALADSLPNLPERLRVAGVVPSGYLIEQVGLRGHRLGGAMLAPRHANFIVNVGDATAVEIRSLAELAKSRVSERFGVRIEEEVLYLGDWSDWPSVQLQ
jgi:UDP-N-acetylmuramate dehydrogenase